MNKFLKKIQYKEKFFIHYFLISLVLMLIVCACWMFFKHSIYNLFSHFYNITFKDFASNVLCAMTLWRILIIQFALAPAIALMCIKKHACNDAEIGEEYKKHNF